MENTAPAENVVDPMAALRQSLETSEHEKKAS